MSEPSLSEEGEELVSAAGTPTGESDHGSERPVAAVTDPPPREHKRIGHRSPSVWLGLLAVVGLGAWYLQRQPLEPVARVSGHGPSISANTRETKAARPAARHADLEIIDLDEEEAASAQRPSAQSHDEGSSRADSSSIPSEHRSKRPIQQGKSSHEAAPVTPPAPDGDRLAEVDAKSGDTEAGESASNGLSEKEATQPGSAASEPTASASVEPAVQLPPFDTQAAKAALAASALQASSCRRGDDPKGTAEVLITFAPSGRITSANVSGPPFGGTQTGGCIANTMRHSSVPAFAGPHVTVRKLVQVR